MTLPARQMRLTAELVARVPPHSGDGGRLAGRSDRPGDADIAAVAAALLAGRPGSADVSVADVWVFAYGSLIWNPGFDFVEERLGTVAGWHRSFCLGWVRIYRGTPERPGIMLAMDRGGSCRGVVFRLPPDAVHENMLKILRREMPIKRANFPSNSARWISVQTKGGPLRALAFPISRQSDAYLPGLTTEMVVKAIATAAGERGSMAEYLHSTVTHLEQRGVHDRYLWKMQNLVADWLENSPDIGN